MEEDESKPSLTRNDKEWLIRLIAEARLHSFWFRCDVEDFVRVQTEKLRNGSGTSGVRELWDTKTCRRS